MNVRTERQGTVDPSDSQLRKILHSYHQETCGHPFDRLAGCLWILPEGACQKCYFPDPAKLDKPALRETVRLVEKCGSYELTTIEAMCLMKFWATCMDESGARCGDGTFVIDFAAARIDQLRVSVGRHQFADVLERWSPGADTKDAREICRKIYREPVEEW